MTNTQKRTQNSRVALKDRGGKRIEVNLNAEGVAHMEMIMKARGIDERKALIHTLLADEAARIAKT